MFIWGDDADTMNIWKSAGYSPIPLSATDILPNLQTGMINCFDTTPVAALSFQWFALAKHMTNMKWCPSSGHHHHQGRLGQDPRLGPTAVLKAAAKAGKSFKDDIRVSNDKAIESMKKYGLEVHNVTPEQYAQWETLFKSVYPRSRGRSSRPTSWICDQVPG